MIDLATFYPKSFKNASLKPKDIFTDNDDTIITTKLTGFQFLLI